MAKSAKQRFSYVVVDVFTRRALEGNQLAVFTDARQLDAPQMQAIAREMNFSETTFVLPQPAAIEKKQGFKVRIFTPQEELPFAGHPTLGTAYVLQAKNRAAEITLDLRAGKIPVRFENRSGALFGEMRQREPEFGKVHAREPVAAAIGLKADELESNLPIQTVSTGFPFCIVPVRRLEELRGLQLQWPRAEAYLKQSDARFFYLVSRETEDPKATLHARMIFYNGEDPATGSAAGCATAWMVANGVLASGKQGMIEQGIEARRPSQLFVRAERNGSKATKVRVGGYVVEVMRGELML
jgi:trans-2,3-dihydro-3-hydroxyanthranilate isomerase